MAKPTWKEIFRSLTKKNMMIAMIMGFSSGVPLLLASRTLQAWLSYAGATNVMVGVAAIIALPYSFKFLWAPLLDRYEFPILGRRRGWLLASQVALLITILLLSQSDPVGNVQMTFVFAFFIAFFGATQDIIVDAYRRESLDDEELGLASSVYQLGYRVAMWLTGGVALILAGKLSWNTSYAIMSTLMLVGIITTLWADEPKSSFARPHSLKDAIILPLKEFFSRRGAILFLLFILLYKLGDSMAGNMLTKLYKDLQFTPEEVGLIAKTMGPIAFLSGTFLGGLSMIRIGINRALFIFGVFQAVAILSFIYLNHSGHSLPALTFSVFLEDFSTGMASAAFLAFMASLTNRAFTATQYALLTSFMAMPRTIISASTGYLVDTLGWDGFFVFCTIMALPGLFLLVYLMKRGEGVTEPKRNGSSTPNTINHEPVTST